MDYREPEWVAERLGVDKNTLYKFLHEGTIPAIQLGRKWLISEKRLEEWLALETERQTRARREAVERGKSTPARLAELTADARQALRVAHGEARMRGHGELDSAHLLLGVMEQRASAAARALRGLGVTTEGVGKAIEATLKQGPGPVARRLPRSPAAKRAMRLAMKLARREGEGKALSPIGTDHLLLGVLLARRGGGYEILEEHRVTRQALVRAVNEAKGFNGQT